MPTTDTFSIIDANVILRYLLCDDADMSSKAKAVIEAGASVTVEVMAEVVYVLNGVYKAERSRICDCLTDLLDEVLTTNKDATVYSLQLYKETTLDFVDCILIGYHNVLEKNVFSFDKKLNKQLKTN